MTMGTVRVCLCAATVHESGARLVALPQPSQFNHYSPKPTVAGLADPLFAFNATTAEGSCPRSEARCYPGLYPQAQRPLPAKNLTTPPRRWQLYARRCDQLRSPERDSLQGL
jgi:hypothetical protein